ncbi:MAG: class I SAM-dependent methyltransferase [Elusimicrobia bacterium]|nr:class I SAM-dependent methyltransferase [Elusimicrobiota bacterium]
MRCPVCLNESGDKLVEEYFDPVGKKKYKIYFCQLCLVQFSWPFNNPGKEWYALFSSSRSYSYESKKFNKLLKASLLGKSLLDIGCGNGIFVKKAQQKGYDALGIDLNKEAIDVANSLGINNVCCSDLDGFLISNKKKYDVVTMFDCLEHMDDLNESIVKIKNILSPEGRIVLTVPNSKRPIFIKRDSFDYPPHHLTRWTKESLEIFLHRHGFKVEEMDVFGLTTWEFSRHLVVWIIDFALKIFKVIVFKDFKNMKENNLTKYLESDNINNKGLIGLILNTIKSRKTRDFIIQLFRQTLYILTFPFFYFFKLYYSLTMAEPGVTIYAVAKNITFKK